MNKCHVCPKASQYQYGENFFCEDCISKVVVREPDSERKQKKRYTVKKSFREVDARKNYSGEASPYWDSIFALQDPTGEGMHVFEDPIANPDVLSEEKSLYNRPLTPEGERQMQAVFETMEGLTTQQRKIVQLSHEGVWSDKEGQRVYTEQAIATALGITRDNVHMSLSRIKTKIRRRYEKSKAAQE